MTQITESDRIENLLARLIDLSADDILGAPWMKDLADTFASTVRELLQARQALAELKALVQRTDAITQVRNHRKVARAEAEAELFAAKEVFARDDERLQRARFRLQALHIVEDPVRALLVGSITARERDLIEIAMLRLLDDSRLPGAREAFSVSQQQPVGEVLP